MDKRLTDALEFANYSHTLFNQKKLAHQKFIDSCVHYHNAGKFTITQQLITFCELNKKSIILLDDNNIPVHIDNVSKFLKIIKEKYNNAISAYHTEYQKITSSKTVSGIINV